MEWLNHFAPAVQAVSAAIIAILTIVIVYATFQYVRVSEALQKPSVTIKSEPRDPQLAVIMAPDVAQVAQAPQAVLINVGTGPALNLSYTFRDLEAEQGTPDRLGFVNYLASGGEWKTQVAWLSLLSRNFIFLAAYESLSGKEYKASFTIRNGVIRRI